MESGAYLLAAVVYAMTIPLNRYLGKKLFVSFLAFGGIAIVIPGLCFNDSMYHTCQLWAMTNILLGIYMVTVQKEIKLLYLIIVQVVYFIIWLCFSLI